VEQIDEIIQQLNSIEVKYQSDISNLRASFTMKESNIVSLNALIIQARVKNAKLTDEATQQQVKNSAQRVEYDAVLKIQKDLEASIQGVQSEIKKTLAQREKLIAEAIRSAQEEIKIAAEKQFAQSNIAFIQLKKDLAVVEDEKKVWFKRAEEATSKLDDISSNSNRRIDDLARQVSKAREDLEFSKTDVSRTKQQLVHERTVFTERVESMTRDVTRLGKECAEAHQLAETIEQEKSQLKREANELKALSDELMSLVGG
jgi:chromosome segregation ATPase